MEIYMERTETIGFKVRALANSIRNIGSKSSGCQFAVNENSRKLTHVHGWVIGFLYDNRDRDVFQKDVEKQFAVSRPTMSAILQSMEKNGLIIREKDGGDARLKRLTLTDKALSIHQKHEDHIELFETKLREGISDEELKGFFATIEKITENLKREEERLNAVNKK